MSKIIDCSITNIKEYGPLLRKYTLKLSKRVNYEPGQYLQLSLENVNASDYWPESRAFSIASFNANFELDLYIKRSGLFTSKIHEMLNVNDKISIKLPYGDFLLPDIDENTKIVCLSNGVGITPFLSFIDYMEMQNKLNNMYLFHTFRYFEDLIGLEKISKLNTGSLNLFITGNPDSRFVYRRMIEDDINRYKFENETYFYISGSNDFISYINQMLKKNGYNNINIDNW